MRIHKPLSADRMFSDIRNQMGEIKEHRPMNVVIPLQDALMSGLTLFALKDPSLLAFEERRATPQNLHQLFGIEQIPFDKLRTPPSDTQLRTILDGVDPQALRPLYKSVFSQLEEGKVLEEMRFFQRYCLLALDGTQYFSSATVHCDSCLERKNTRTGAITYSHQMLGAAIVHPDHKTVIPLAPEPIIKQDGAEKNDCERNAAKRFFEKLRQDHPRLPLIVVEDALSSNAPHIEELKRHKLRFILGVKPGDHGYLFAHVAQAKAEGRTTEFEFVRNGVTHRFCYLNDAPLNESNAQVRVNFLEYWEIKGNQTRHFTWVTDFTIDRTNAYTLSRGGRARWKIENETFNTLKNQGYHFEHNFGHGQQHLSVVFALLMLLAFAIDQSQQMACQLFQDAWAKAGSKRFLWERMRSLFHELPFDSMTDIWRAIAFGFHIEGRIVIHDSS